MFFWSAYRENINKHFRFYGPDTLSGEEIERERESSEVKIGVFETVGRSWLEHTPSLLSQTIPSDIQKAT